MPPAPPEVLLPLGAGVVVLVVALSIVLLVRRARRRRGADVTAAARTAPPTAAEAVRAPAAPDPVWRDPATGRGASGRTVAGAVERALAAREAHSRGDARDRLLAVLLDDPVRAVGATVELDASRRRLDRLTDAVRHERATLGDVLARLSAAGLDDRRLARLAGLPDDELRRLLPEAADR